MAEKQNISFSREQLLRSRRYQAKRDILYAILADKKNYTLAEVDAKIEKFLKGKAK